MVSTEHAQRKDDNVRDARKQSLGSLTERALQEYFSKLNGHTPNNLYDIVMHEIEPALLRTVMDETEGNQSRAAQILGINRGTLRKKLLDYGLLD